MKTEASGERPGWSLLRWLILIAFVFTLQVALIFGLSDPPRRAKPAAAPVPVLRLAGRGWAPLLAVSDPTWFALPHRQGFSGLAWMKVPEFDATDGEHPDPVDFQPFRFHRQPEWLAPARSKPAAAFCEFVRTNHFEVPLAAPRPELALTLPEVVPLPLAGEHSQLVVQGELAQRPLLSQFHLGSWDASALLTNSVVQVFVDASGWPRSAALLEQSGSAKADALALELAARAHFGPLPEEGSARQGGAQAGLMPGLLVFQWHTVAASSTGPATAGP